jgi:phage terminase small subunit
MEFAISTGSFNFSFAGTFLPCGSQLGDWQDADPIYQVLPHCVGLPDQWQRPSLGALTGNRSGNEIFVSTGLGVCTPQSPIASCSPKVENRYRSHGENQLSDSMGKKPRPPKSLDAAGRELWQELQAEYDISDAGGLRLLRTACECRDLDVAAMAIARSEGLCQTDKYGQKRPHPMLSVARDARAQMLTALKALNLSVEPIQDGPGRPAGR